MTGFEEADARRELVRIRSKIDREVFDLYGVDFDARASLDDLFLRVDTAAPEPESDDDGEPLASISTESIVSWLIGVAFGRFNLTFATGGQARALREPKPTDPLPVRSPGMTPFDDSESELSRDVLVDDPGHARDIAALARSGAEVVDVMVSDDIGRWLTREFFPLHIKMYSKSRRKAPIYWQLATPSASYSVWLYIQAFTRDTMFRVQNDFVVPKLRLEENRLAALESEAGDKPTATARKEIDRQREFVAELRAFLDEVRRVAPLWDPDLDDGVIINFAPLWRLVPQHRPWQTELKKTWDELCAGKYDWAHLAMRLWPERVVPKCATDRSLAIAHGLEDVFWTERKEGWVVRTTPTRSLDDLIAERSSDAVRAALRALLDAPVTSPARGGRRRAATRATS